MIIEKDEQFVKINNPVRVVNTHVSNLDILYVVGKRKIKVGNSEKALITHITPLKMLKKDDWVFDSLIEANLDNFDVSVNMVINCGFHSIIFC